MTRVLIVDGDETFRTTHQQGLEEFGYDVLAASTGAEAAALALSQPLDAIVAALDLPDVSGTLFCRWLTAHPKTRIIPVIIVATRGDEQDRTDSFGAGAASFVVKPVGLGEMKFRLRLLLPGATARAVHVNGTAGQSGAPPGSKGH